MDNFVIIWESGIWNLDRDVGETWARLGRDLDLFRSEMPNVPGYGGVLRGVAGEITSHNTPFTNTKNPFSVFAP